MPVANALPCCRFVGVRERPTIEGKPTLWGTLKRKEPDAELRPEPGLLSTARSTDSLLRVSGRTPDADSNVGRLTPTPESDSRPRYVVGTLYPRRKPEPEPLVHARALIEHVQLYAEDAVGTYIPSRELKRVYGELCEREGWKPRSWSAIGTRLTELTDDHRRLNRGGRQFWAHLIPRSN